MENITIDKDKLLTTYRTANNEQKEILKQLYGKNIFPSDWREITSYEKACEVLGIEPIEFKEVGDRPQYMRMANAMQQLLVICEAVNGDGGWYDENSWGYYPVFVLYSKYEMDEIGEAERKRKGIHQLLAVYNTYYAEFAGIRCANTSTRGAHVSANFGFPLCLNSEKKQSLLVINFLSFAAPAMV